MSGMQALALLLLWVVLLLGAWLVGPLKTHREPGRAGQVATWLLLTFMTLVYLSVLIFVVTHVLLFTLGTGAAAIGLLVSLILLLGTPVAWWFGVRAMAHRLGTQRHDRH